MEVALGGGDGDFSTDLDVDGEIGFPGQSGSFDVDDTDGLDVGLSFTALNDVDQVLGLSGLGDHDNGFSFDNVVLTEFDWVDNIDLLESFQEFEEVVAGAGGVVARATAQEGHVWAEGDGLDSAEIGLEGDLGLPSDFVLVESFVGFWWHLQDFIIVGDDFESSVVF